MSSTAFIVICERCDAREFLGGNVEARLKLLIAQGWHYRERGENHCPTCWKRVQAESRRGQ